MLGFFCRCLTALIIIPTTSPTYNEQTNISISYLVGTRCPPSEQSTPRSVATLRHLQVLALVFFSTHQGTASKLAPIQSLSVPFSASPQTPIALPLVNFLQLVARYYLSMSHGESCQSLSITVSIPHQLRCESSSRSTLKKAIYHIFPSSTLHFLCSPTVYIRSRLVQHYGGSGNYPLIFIILNISSRTSILSKPQPGPVPCLSIPGALNTLI